MQQLYYVHKIVSLLYDPSKKIELFSFSKQCKHHDALLNLEKG